ncbi:MAG: alpha/beta fold hydrolase [Myxococcales bacterium]|nr:alpha/beta fold hydrolase [Myxococcales bacterium]
MIRGENTINNFVLIHLGLALTTATTACIKDKLVSSKDREGFRTAEIRIPSDPGIEIFVTRVEPVGSSRGAVVLTHGAGSPSSAVWHLPLGYSIMETLASHGFDTYAVDVRGFGGSTRPTTMLSVDTQSPAAVRASEVMPDINAVVKFAQANSGHPQVDLVGWSWGCVVAGMYASSHAESIRRLLLYAPVFDRKWPKRHKIGPASRIESRELHMKWLDPTQEDPKIRQLFVERLFRFEESPDQILLPNGPYRDIYGPDTPVWNPSAVLSATLIIRGSNDLASLRGPAIRLYEALTKAQYRQYTEVANMGHFAFRTFKNPQLKSLILNFLVAPLGSD